jgi:hypothetical protein
MKRPRRSNRSLVIALYVNAVLLAAVLVVLLTRGDAPHLVTPAYGQTQVPIAGGAGLFVMPAQFSSSTWGCYVMDVDSQTLCAYQFVPGEKYLRFIAARNFKFDRQLRNFNTEPSPLEVKDLVEKEQGPAVNAAPASGANK